MSMSCCPTCGQGFAAIEGVRWNIEARVLTWPGGAAEFTPRQAAIFDVLWRALEKGATLTGAQLVARAYADDINGGPENRNAVVVHLYQMRKRLIGSPLQIARNAGRKVQPYRLTMAAVAAPLTTKQQRGEGR